jgi:hypothetical protein
MVQEIIKEDRSLNQLTEDSLEAKHQMTLAKVKNRQFPKYAHRKIQ